MDYKIVRKTSHILHIPVRDVPITLIVLTLVQVINCEYLSIQSTEYLIVLKMLYLQLFFKLKAHVKLSSHHSKLQKLFSF